MSAAVARARAIQLLEHYLGNLHRAAGLQWSGDNSAEMEELADALIDAALAAGR